MDVFQAYFPIHLLFKLHTAHIVFCTVLGVVYIKKIPSYYDTVHFGFHSVLVQDLCKCSIIQYHMLSYSFIRQ